MDSWNLYKIPKQYYKIESENFGKCRFYSQDEKKITMNLSIEIFFPVFIYINFDISIISSKNPLWLLK